MSHSVDVAVIGAGVVGCAAASALACRGLEVVILEREGRAGTGVTSRNSGVIHSGIYYPPTSRKARTCVRGNQMLYAWAVQRGVAHRRTGKLVVARDDDDVEELARIHENATASGALGVCRIDGSEVARRQPGLPPMQGALWCPHSGIIDAHQLTTSLLADAQRNGAWLAPQAHVTAVSTRGDGFRVHTTRDVLDARRVVNAAGLYADDIARMLGLNEHSIHPCRGDYFRLRTPHSYRHLIYPIRRPDQPGLGIHLTLGLDGSYRLGPDSEYANAKDDFTPAEYKRSAFATAARRLLGPLGDEQLDYDGCGIRPKLRAPEGTHEEDFVVRDHPAGVLHLLGIESPGLTAALALAEDVCTWAITGCVPP